MAGAQGWSGTVWVQIDAGMCFLPSGLLVKYVGLMSMWTVLGVQLNIEASFRPRYSTHVDIVRRHMDEVMKTQMKLSMQNHVMQTFCNMWCRTVLRVLHKLISPKTGPSTTWCSSNRVKGYKHLQSYRCPHFAAWVQDSAQGAAED